MLPSRLLRNRDPVQGNLVLWGAYLLPSTSHRTRPTCNESFMRGYSIYTHVIDILWCRCRTLIRGAAQACRLRSFCSKATNSKSLDASSQLTNETTWVLAGQRFPSGLYRLAPLMHNPRKRLCSRQEITRTSGQQFDTRCR
jgi:hypothetical protein